MKKQISLLYVLLFLSVGAQTIHASQEPEKGDEKPAQQDKDLNKFMELTRCRASSLSCVIDYDEKDRVEKQKSHTADGGPCDHVIRWLRRAPLFPRHDNKPELVIKLSVSLNKSFFKYENQKGITPDDAADQIENFIRSVRDAQEEKDESSDVQ